MHACMKICEKQDRYCYTTRIINERREYNNFAFDIYLYQIKCSEYLSQSIDICCKKCKEIYMHIKIKHSQ